MAQGGAVMPVIGIPIRGLLDRLGTDIDRKELIKHLEHLGCDVEGYTELRRYMCKKCDFIHEFTETEAVPGRCGNCEAETPEGLGLDRLENIEVVRMELLAVRPDMFDMGGLARALRGYLGLEMGLPVYELKLSGEWLDIAEGLDTDECRRPDIACAVMKGVTLDDDLVKVIMKLQDNLHWAMGRNRKHASIGVYDLDKVTPPFIYCPAGKNAIRFVPLGGMPGKGRVEATPDEILSSHPKGTAFADLLKPFSQVPILKDSTGRVLSMPPVINSEDTRVTTETRNFFIDVTGTGPRIVGKVLNIMVTSIAELCPGVEIGSVEIRGGSGTRMTPDFNFQEVILDPAAACRLIGVEMDRMQIQNCLLRMRHSVSDTELDDSPGLSRAFRVRVPAYRNDILHERDLVEDIAIAYGYHNIVTSLVPTMTVGSELPVTRLISELRADLCGQGFLEVISLMLTSEDKHFRMMTREPKDTHVTIENPASSEQAMVRESVLPGLMEILSNNTHNTLPQRIFEVGDVTVFDPTAETGAREAKRLSAAIVSPRAGYTDVRSATSGLLKRLGVFYRIEPVDEEGFIPGRCARIILGHPGKERSVGFMGEVHPLVLENFRIIHPVAAFEIDVETLLSTCGGGRSPDMFKSIPG